MLVQIWFRVYRGEQYLHPKILIVSMDHLWYNFLLDGKSFRVFSFIKLSYFTFHIVVNEFKEPKSI